MSRRKLISLSDDEVRDFLAKSRTIVLTSIGRDGVPHPMPMWFAIDDDGAISMTTFRKSQKVKNLERDPRVSLLAEDGEVYTELRGVVLYGQAELLSDEDAVVDTLARIARRTGGTGDASPEAVQAGFRRTAPKRVAIRVRPERVVSWDHRKLGGTY